jgi:hypothetical protein
VKVDLSTTIDLPAEAACPNGIKYVQAIGFIVIVNTRRGDYENLAIFYSIAREMAKARFDVNTLESASVVMVIERLIYLLNDYRSVEKEGVDQEERGQNQCVADKALKFHRNNRKVSKKVIAERKTLGGASDATLSIR